METLAEHKRSNFEQLGQLMTPSKGAAQEDQERLPEPGSFKKPVYQTPNPQNSLAKVDVQDLNVTVEEMDSGVKMLVEACLKMKEARDFMRKTLKMEDEKHKGTINESELLPSYLKQLPGERDGAL